MGVFVALRHAGTANFLSRSNWFWLALGGGLVILTTVQAFRKWRFESEHPEDLSGA
jgi:hypothetical protein